MLAAPIFSAMLLQNETVSGLTQGQVTMLMVFAAAVTVAVIIQCVALIGVAIGAAKARKEVLRLTSELHSSAMPVIARVSALVEESAPKLRSTINNVEEITTIARKKAVEIDSLATEMIMRTRQETRRVDGMVANTLDKVENLRDSVNHALMAPVRQAAGAIAAIKAGFEKLRDQIPQSLQYVAGMTRRQREKIVGEGEDYHA